MSAFSDFRDNLLDSIGIDKQLRDVGQETFNTLTNQFGGNIPTPAGTVANRSDPQPTGPSFLDQILAPKIGSIPVIPLAAAVILGFYLLRKK